MNNGEKIYPYLDSDDVENMYLILKGSRKGLYTFMKNARKLGVISKSTLQAGKLIFKDEDALFELFKSTFPQELKIRKIVYFGELIQMIS